MNKLDEYMEKEDYNAAIERREAWQSYLKTNHPMAGDIVSLSEHDTYISKIFAECNRAIAKADKAFMEQYGAYIEQDEGVLIALLEQKLEEKRYLDLNQFMPRANYRSIDDQITATKSEVITRCENKLLNLNLRYNLIYSIIEYYRHRVHGYVNILNLGSIYKLKYDSSIDFVVSVKAEGSDNSGKYVNISLLDEITLAIDQTKRKIKELSIKLGISADDFVKMNNSSQNKTGAPKKGEK